jgi:hypothetical protein
MIELLMMVTIILIEMPDENNEDNNENIDG